MKNKILCIDPGPIYSGVATFEDGVLVYADKIKSLEVLKFDVEKHSIVLIEKMEARGMIAGNSVIDTAIICGRLKQQFINNGANVFFIERREVINTLKCKNDSAVIKLLRENLQIKQGVKISKDAWQAAALYYVYRENLL